MRYFVLLTAAATLAAGSFAFAQKSRLDEGRLELEILEARAELGRLAAAAGEQPAAEPWLDGDEFFRALAGLRGLAEDFGLQDTAIAGIAGPGLWPGTRETAVRLSATGPLGAVFGYAEHLAAEGYNVAALLLDYDAQDGRARLELEIALFHGE